MAQGGSNKQSGSNKKVANSLVAVSCGAVLAVYTAGYVRTRAAVEQFEAQAAERRAADPVPQRIESPLLKSRPEAPPPRLPAPPASESSFAASASSNRSLRIEKPPEPVQAYASAVATVPEAAPAAPTETPAPPPAAPVAALIAAPAVAPVVAPVAAPVVAPMAAPVAVQAFTPAPPPPAEHKAEASVAAPAAPAWKDGTYFGWGTSRHGDIQAQVIIEGGRIASAAISQCRTRYSCSVIDRLPPQVAQRQSPDVDYVSRATQSANAFYFAVVDALSKAK